MSTASKPLRESDSELLALVPKYGESFTISDLVCQHNDVVTAPEMSGFIQRLRADGMVERVSKRKNPALTDICQLSEGMHVDVSVGGVFYCAIIEGITNKGNCIVKDLLTRNLYNRHFSEHQWKRCRFGNF